MVLEYSPSLFLCPFMSQESLYHGGWLDSVYEWKRETTGCFSSSAAIGGWGDHPVGDSLADEVIDCADCDVGEEEASESAAGPAVSTFVCVYLPFRSSLPSRDKRLYVYVCMFVGISVYVCMYVCVSH